MSRRGARVCRAAAWSAAIVLHLVSGGLESAAAHEGRQPKARVLSGRAPGKPAYLWIWLADGKSRPSESSPPPCDQQTPSKYECGSGSADDCMRDILPYLDAWYADFNLLFTFTRPPGGDYYAVVVTSDGSWCPRDTPDAGIIEAGISYLSGCNDIPGFAGYALECGGSAHDCASLIAHEHAHMVGLEHTDSITDVMNPRLRATAAGFDKQDNLVIDDKCDELTQNSYDRMLATLGAWPGGAKPSPLAGTPDAGAPDAAKTDGKEDAPKVGSIGDPFPVSGGDGSVGVISGFDSLSRPLPDITDAAPVSQAPHRGCSVMQAQGGDGAFALASLFAVAAAVRLLRSRRAAAGAGGATQRSP